MAINGIKAISALGVSKPQENITIQKVSKLGIPNNQLDYEDSFRQIDPKKVKLLIEHLSCGYFINNKFESKNYVDQISFLKNQEQKDLLIALSTKKDKIGIAQDKISYETKKTKEELEREIEESYYFLLSKSISLNTTVAFIDNEASRNGYRINLDYENEIISYSYVIYYNVSDESIIRKDSKIDTSKTNFAVILNAGGVETLFFFIEKAYTKSDADILRKKIFDDYNVELNKTTDVETLAFLYDNLPHYIELGFEIIEPNEKEPKKHKLSDELLWKHLKLFVDYDNGLSDASYYVVKLMSLISPKFCLQQFVKDQSLIVKIYNGLDDRNGINELFGVYKFSKTFEIGGTTFEHSNKDAFISLLNTYIQLNEGDPEVVVFESSGAHFHQGIKKEGKYDAVVQFTLNSNIVLSDSKENKVEISNHWESKKYLGQALDSQGHISEQYDIERGYNESGYFNPLDVVKFTQYNDEGEAITINVPAIYVKYASDLAEWEKVDKALRLGVDILMIIGGIATITSGAGSLLLYAAISDVGLAYTDIIIQSETDKAYFKSKEGKEFLESWNKIYTVGSVVTFSPIAIKAVATYGPKIISSGADLLQVSRKMITNPEVYKKIKDLTTKAIHSIEIPNFNKTGLEILKKGFTDFAELKNARKLQDLGVIFAKGAEDTVAVIYKGVVIASGKVKEVAQQLYEILKLTGNKLSDALSDLLDVCTLVFKNKKYLDVILYVFKNSKRELKEFLSIHEEAIIFYYTTSAYENLNMALRGLINLQKEYISFERLLNSALNKLPNSIYNGPNHILYRSVEMSDELIQNLFVGKTTYIEKAFTSTAYDYQKFLDHWFQWNPSHNVIFKIQGKNGKLVEAISDIDVEAEILFKSKTKYEIISVVDDVNPLDNLKEITYITLKEI